MKKIFRLIGILWLLTGCISQQTRGEILQEKGQVSQRVAFIAAGDNLIHKKLIDEAYQNGTYDFTPYYQHIRSYIEKYDLSFVNQETILGGEQFGYSGYPLFNTPDEMAKTLSQVGFDIVNGSNNHTLDMGEAGVSHAIEIFSQYPDMTFIGLRQTDIPVVEKNGIKIAFLAYCQSINGNKTSSSIAKFDKQNIEEDVKKAKEISDCIIVSCHWGNEYDLYPDEFQKEYAQFFADLGVDVIIGSHSHTLQSVEWVEGKNGHQTLVAYSLGNLISGMMEEETQLGGLLSFDIVKEHQKVVIEQVILTPVVNHFQVHDYNNRMNTRYGFSVYRLKDYTELLASQHGLNGYHGIEISVEKLKKTVKERIIGIDIDM